MKTFITIILSLFLAFSCLAETLTCKVVSVYDGDTVTVLNCTTQVEIRFEGIDTPESKQPFGTKAKQALSKMVFGKQVKVEWKEKDRYGRTLGNIHCNGKWVNLEMVKQGMAWHYKEYSKDKRLSEAQKKASMACIGLWSDFPNVVAPWDWRNGARSGTTKATKKPESVDKAAPVFVCITDTGVKYHGAGCRYLKNSKHKVSLVDGKVKRMTVRKRCLK
jgi:endonuclease YncB( thermonuclease family)